MPPRTLRLRLAGLSLIVAGLAACRAAPGASGSGTTGALLGDTTFPAGPLGKSARRGFALLANTPDSLPSYAHSELRCLSCHLDDGRRRNALPLVGVYARFPQYRSRDGRVDVIADRINDCFQRSLNGAPLPAESQEIRDITTYLAWMSRGVGVLDTVAGQGVAKLAPLRGDTVRGATLFAEVCARCHGPDGSGGAYTGAGSFARRVPPVWGKGSFNIGAGMARLRTAAGFIRNNMPFDKPGTLSDQDAFDIAAFVVSRPRPDFPGKEKDWPNGDPPPDVAYPTAAARHADARTTPTGAH